MFMFYECNGQRCNNGEVMSSDHHVIGSGFADDVNVINVTATDFHHQSILFRNCPFHLSFRGGSNMFLVKFSVLILCNVKTKTIIDGFVMINVVDVWPATSSGGKLNLNFQSKIPPQDILLCLRDCVWYQAHVGSIESRSPHRQPSSETKYWISRLQTTSEIWKIYQIGSDPGLEIFPDNVLGLPKVDWVLSFVHSSSTSLNNL